ncbi:MAG: ABC-type transport auxiliary lipoprotein family protein [Pseudomonadota bacterium]|nr:ABC-type transport auxiliary lipoprotein family protein [Pseudomonadota bacterium]
MSLLHRGWAASSMGALMGVLSVGLAGCISVGIGTDTGVQPMFELHDPAAVSGTTAQGAPAAARVPTLLIQMLPGNAVAETTSIAYSRQPHEVAFYKLATWGERPVHQIPRLLQQRLQARDVAGAVGLLGDPLRSDWLPTLTVERLVHDVATPPGLAQLRLDAAVYDRRNGQRIGRRAFVATAPAATATSSAAVAAMSVALSRSFDELTPWLEVQLQAGMARRQVMSRSESAAPAAASASAPSRP